MTLLIISFIAGMLTVLAPCVLPLLPIVIGGSLSDARDRAKPYIITASLVVSVFVFTLLLKASTLVIDIPQSFWTWFSGGILIMLGLMLVFPTLWEHLPINALVNRKSQALLAEGSNKKSIWGDVIMGVALGPVFSTCSPTYFVILATVLPSSLVLGLLYLLAYTVGLALMLILIALIGQRLVTKLGGAADPHGWVKRGMGVVILLVGFAIIAGIDKKIEAALLDVGIFDVTQVEQQLLNKVDTTSSDSSASTPGTTLLLKNEGTAPELTQLSGYIHTDGKPITIGEFHGKGVVLVDFWTYSCINCRRTVPYLNTWYERYKDKGFTIIGVHTPEFAFEHMYDNVAAAVKELGIMYPVVLDNDYGTWNAFGNRFWPRKYLVDDKGNIVYDHIGEGGYDETEEAIQEALRELGTLSKRMPIGTVTGATDVNVAGVGSPETYFGSNRNAYLANGTRGKSGVQVFTIPATIKPNTLYLGGSWNMAPEYAETNTPNAEVVYRFTAKNVYMVAASNGRSVVDVFVDGHSIREAESGVDVVDSSLDIGEDRLYHIYSGGSYESHTLRLHMRDPGLQVFTFTFG